MEVVWRSCFGDTLYNRYPATSAESALTNANKEGPRIMTNSNFPGPGLSLTLSPPSQSNNRAVSIPKYGKVRSQRVPRLMDDPAAVPPRARITENTLKTTYPISARYTRRRGNFQLSRTPRSISVRVEPIANYSHGRERGMGWGRTREQTFRGIRRDSGGRVAARGVPSRRSRDR